MKLVRLTILIFPLLLSSGCHGKPSEPLAGGKPIDHWLKSLSDPDAKLRKEAAAKLGNVGGSDPTVVSALCGALNDRNADVRCQAILAIVKLGPSARDALEPLKALEKNDSNPRVRDYAAKAREKLEQ